MSNIAVVTFDKEEASKVREGPKSQGANTVQHRILGTQN
jgi:hypothetical protein